MSSHKKLICFATRSLSHTHTKWFPVLGEAKNPNIEKSQTFSECSHQGWRAELGKWKDTHAGLGYLDLLTGAYGS